MYAGSSLRWKLGQVVEAINTWMLAQKIDEVGLQISFEPNLACRSWICFKAILEETKIMPGQRPSKHLPCRRL